MKTKEKLRKIKKDTQECQIQRSIKNLAMMMIMMILGRNPLERYQILHNFH